MQCRVGRQTRAKDLRGHGLGPAGHRVAQHPTTVLLNPDARMRGEEVRNYARVHACRVAATARVRSGRAIIHREAGPGHLRWRVRAVIPGYLSLSPFREVRAVCNLRRVLDGWGHTGAVREAQTAVHRTQGLWGRAVRGQRRRRWVSRQPVQEPLQRRLRTRGRLVAAPRGVVRSNLFL